MVGVNGDGVSAGVQGWRLVGVNGDVLAGVRGWWQVGVNGDDASAARPTDVNVSLNDLVAGGSWTR